MITQPSSAGPSFLCHKGKRIGERKKKEEWKKRKGWINVEE